MISSIDERYMRRAIALAALSSDTAPNPPVGAVIVHGDHIIGEGHHDRPGSPHAEVMALQSVHLKNRHLLPDSVMYVTLEPCNHHGRTGPCSQAIQSAGIKKVYVGTADPNPHVTGSGADALRDTGVEVVMPMLEYDAKALILPFYIWTTHARPYIFLKYAMSSDGYMAQKGKSIWLSGDQFGRKAHQWRSTHQAILVGTDTARLDDPSLTTRYASGPSPVRVILDRTGRLAKNLTVFTDGNPSILITARSEKMHASPEVKQLQLAESQWEWKAIIDLLWQQKIYTLMVEGGQKILSSLLKDGFWDLAAVAQSPTAIHKGLKAPLPSSIASHTAMCGDDKIHYYQRTTF